jgi:hypothetical protein
MLVRVIKINKLRTGLHAILNIWNSFCPSSENIKYSSHFCNKVFNFKLLHIGYSEQCDSILIYLHCSGPACSTCCTIIKPRQLQLGKGRSADKYLTNTDFLWQGLLTNTNPYFLLHSLKVMIMTATALSLPKSLLIRFSN